MPLYAVGLTIVDPAAGAKEPYRWHIKEAIGPVVASNTEPNGWGVEIYNRTSVIVGSPLLIPIYDSYVVVIQPENAPPAGDNRSIGSFPKGPPLPPPEGPHPEPCGV